MHLLVTFQANYVHALYIVAEGGVKIKLRYQQPHEAADTLSKVQTVISQTLDNFAPTCEPVEIVSDEMMQAAAVSLGCFGVVYALEFYCEPAYDIAETRITVEIPLPQDESSIRLPRALRSGIGLDPDCSSIDKETPSARKSSDPFVFSFFVNPYADENGKLHCTVLDGKKQARPQQVQNSTYIQKASFGHSTSLNKESSEAVNLGDTMCKCPLCCLTCGVVCERRGLNTTIECIQTDMSAAALHAVSLFGSQTMIREATSFSMYGFEHAMTRVDKWYEVLQITKGNIQ